VKVGIGGYGQLERSIPAAPFMNILKKGQIRLPAHVDIRRRLRSADIT
jgi:hypothetical protein